MNSYCKIISLAFLMSGFISPVDAVRYKQSYQAEDTLNISRLVRVDSFRLSIIPPSSGIGFYKDNIIFLSLSKNERKMSADHISFGAVEAYYASVQDSVTGSHLIFIPGFLYPAEAMTFNKDYSTIYFSKAVRKIRKEKIFTAGFGINDKNQPELVTEPVALEFCSDSSNYSHPVLSSDGKFMVFASDTKGSVGGMDLFISRLSGGKWSSPQNLGNMINTTGNEYFPFLDNENNLYFSSDKSGLGGYDLFSCKFNGESWNKPVNMSDQINSPFDEIAIAINKTDGKTGFFTRKSGKSLQLMKISLKPEASDKNLLAIFNPATELVETKPETIKPDTLTAAEKKITETPIAEKQPVKPAAAPASKPPDARSVIIRPTLPVPPGQKDIVIYRVQILSSNNPKREKSITLNGKSYDLYEYFYLGSYRYSIGEFRTPGEALQLQKQCRQSAFPQAFAAAFKNNTRSTDLKTFK